MAISKQHKQKLVAQYEDEIRNSRAMILTEYRGLSTAEMNKLRSAVRDAQGMYSVVKLTLFKLALERSGTPVPTDLMEGPTAIGFCHQEVPAVAKAFKDFTKDQELLVIKGGIMGDRLLSNKEVVAIASLPPMEVVRSQLLGVINGPARSLAGAIASGVRQVINVVNAYSEQGSAESGA